MANLLKNGTFSASVGSVTTSVAGPFWETDYVVPNCLLFGACSGGGRWNFFTTNAQQSTGQANAATVPALGGRSMSVNVGPSTTQDIIRWRNIPLEHGRKYRMSVDAAVINPVYAVAMYIDGVKQMDLTSPGAAVRQWINTTSVFIWQGTTGLHTVSLRTGSTVAGGNDHAFDNFILEEYELLPLPCCTAAMFCYTSLNNLKVVRRGYIDMSAEVPVARDFATGAILQSGEYIVQPCLGA